MAEEAEQDSGRAGSPYHQKCFPPYCDASPAVDKQTISKMERSDLEDRYIVFADENLALKKRIRDHERHVQRLQTALARQDSIDKKTGAKVPASQQYDSLCAANLEAENKNLQAKVKVLKQQLMNHSFIHTKENRIAENKKRGITHSPDNSFRDVGQTQSAREPKPQRFKDESPSRRESDLLKDRITVLEQMLETQKEKYKARIRQLEKDIAALGKSDTTLNEELSEHSRKVSDNVEMIRLRRSTKKLSAEIDSLTVQRDETDKQISELKENIKKADGKIEELERQLERERERGRDAISHLTKSTSHAETIRVLQEQIRDLQNEKKTLQETNEQLLALTTGKSERSSQESRLRAQISQLEKKLKEKEEQEEQLINYESKTDVPATKSESHHTACRQENEDLKNELNAIINSLKDENNVIADQLETALKEIQDLKGQMKPKVSFKSIPSATLQDEHTSKVPSEMNNQLEELKKENASLEKKLSNALKKVEELKQNSDEHGNKQEFEELKGENEELLRQLEDLKNEMHKLTECPTSRPQTPEPTVVHKDPSNVKQELEELKGENEDLLRQLEDLKNEMHKLTECPTSRPQSPEPTVVYKVPSNVKQELADLKTENEKLEEQLEDLRKEVKNLREISKIHQNCPTSRPHTPEPVIVHKVPSSNQELEELRGVNEELVNQLEDLKNEIHKLTECPTSRPKTPEPTVGHKVPSNVKQELVDLKKENENLEKQLDDLRKEVKELREISKIHQNCPTSRPQTPEPSIVSKIPSNVTQELLQLKRENEELTSQLKDSRKEIENLTEISKVHKNCPTSRPHTPEPMVVHKVPSSVKRELEELKKENEDLGKKLAEITKVHENCPTSRPKTPEPITIEKVPSNFEQAFMEEKSRLETELRHAINELEELRPIAEEHKYCHTSRPQSTGPSTGTGVSAKSSNQVVYPTPVSSYSDWGKKTDSTHQVETESISSEPQKPVVVIVSKHEFDRELYERRQYISQTDMVLPSQGRHVYNCQLEICVYDLEVDNQLLYYLSNLEAEPRVFVSWDFLGLEQRTASMPAGNPVFHTNVSYTGPLSTAMIEHLEQGGTKFQLMLERERGAEQVGQGELNFSSAIQEPGRPFMRCIEVESGHGTAKIYCSYKLHDCSQAEIEAQPANEIIEVGIGHMRLVSSDIPTNTEDTHLYIEYSILGHCGPELETDSVPKGEVMRFNHTKRLRVNQENVAQLEPLLEESEGKPLRFIVLAEPCNLAHGTEVEEIGYADLNLRKEMVDKDQELISTQVPVVSREGAALGSLSVTVIGLDTLQNHAEPKQR